MIDAQLEAVADGDRRRILIGLLERSDGEGVPYAASEDVPSRTGGGAVEVSRELTELHHVHLPKLDDMGYVEWDEEAALVRKGDRFHEIRPLVELLNVHREKLPGDVR